MMKAIFKLFIFTLLLSIIGCGSSSTTSNVENNSVNKEVKSYTVKDFIRDFEAKKFKKDFPPNTKIEGFQVDDKNKIITINFSKEFSYIPLRPDNTKEYYNIIKNLLSENYPSYQYVITSMDYKIEDLIPNFYRESKDYDKTRLTPKDAKSGNVVYNLDRKVNPVNGLYDRNIVIWQSHGWYYSNEGKRWEWQRPRLFQSVEDKVPLSFVLPYLIPMLENAGANVYDPRERDIQVNEVVVDNDGNHAGYKETGDWIKGGDGFALGQTPYYSNENPFTQGSYRFIKSSKKPEAKIQWTPDIPEDGDYSVYIAYKSMPNSSAEAKYTVHHAGGSTNFQINQTMGGGTWIYLGKFYFNKGTKGFVELTNEGEAGKIITADAIRFGGGKSIIARDSVLSNRPKFLEGARYWLQYAGMPDTLVYNLNKGRNDYNDDYQARNEYANYLKGAPYGPNRNRDERGLGIPIDLSMAFHTDAGITSNDTVIGSLSIYCIEDAVGKSVFPDGESRLANRDLADLVQTQVVNDIRSKWDNAWTRRSLMNAQYSEAYRPNMPDLLLELLSHQNLTDMKFVLDPRFRFDVARAIYKGMLKFLSVQNNYSYIVQPLPVNNFSSEITESGSIKLKWNAVNDMNEPTAVPDGYVVYTRTNDKGFDNGVYVKNNEYTLDNPVQGNIYSFKITAVNKGGESFPSEILSVCKNKNPQTILIVNGFHRLSAPASIDTKEYAGFLSNIDAGVQDKYDITTTGYQYDFDPQSPFISNDAPGYGASNGELETTVLGGNTFDYPYLHGLSIKETGFSFVSTSEDAISNYSSLNNYKMIDLIYGKEKTTKYQKAYADSLFGIQFQIFNKELRPVIQSYLNAGGKLLITGSYIASDMYSNDKDSAKINYTNNVLKYKLATGHAAKTGVVTGIRNNFIQVDKLNYNVAPNKEFYIVESPDAIEPVKGGFTFLRYNENQFSAGVAYKNDYGVVSIGFPFESINCKEQRDNLMKQIVNFLIK